MPTRATEPTKSDATILVIEDSAIHGRLLTSLIERSGLGVPMLYGDGLEGLNAFYRHKPAAVLLDLELPRLRGEEICRLIRSSSEYNRVPIIVVSELDDAVRREMELLHIGADAYFKKPFSNEALVEVLKKHLGIGQPHHTTSGIPSADALVPRGGVSAAIAPDDPTSSGESLAERVGAVEAPPTEFQGYRIIQMLGGGGMGTVYLAEQTRLKRRVALKVMLETLARVPDHEDRFEREAQIMAQVNHPNVVQVYDFGRSAVGCYLAMEYVPGLALQKSIDRGLLTWRQKAKVISEMFTAVSHLHSIGIVHRDIKPSNILLTEKGDVKVCDFGISRARLPFDERDFTAREMKVLGTAYFLAPELHEGAEATESTDQYALGVTTALMLGPKPPDGEATTTPVGERRARHTLPEEVKRAVSRAMNPYPELRYESVEQARDTITEVLGRHVDALEARAAGQGRGSQTAVRKQ